VFGRHLLILFSAPRLSAFTLWEEEAC
jgi:hypothetical protein